jgi:hypothetical protein
VFVEVNVGVYSGVVLLANRRGEGGQKIMDDTT